MSDVPLVTFSDGRAVIMANEGPLVTFVDKWNSHGYIASLIEKETDNGGYVYAIGKVVYDLAKVSREKVLEIAKKIANGEFSCPVCRRLATKADEQKPEAKPEGITEEPAKPEVSDITEEKEEKTEAGESERRESDRARAIKDIVNALDDVLLMRVALGK